jgi:hypothetical protein
MSKEKSTKGTSKTEKTRKYYYSKASVIRSAVCAILSFALFVGFFVCFMIYGGNRRDPAAVYRLTSDKEKQVLSMIDGVAADGNGRVYVFYGRTLEINAYDENGNFKESYALPERENGTMDGGIVCENGKLYAFNNAGEVFVYENGKYFTMLDVNAQKERREEIFAKYEAEKDFVTTSSEKTYQNNYVAVVDGEGKVVFSNFVVGVLFSPVSMIMAIIMTVLTYVFVRRYNIKVRNQKLKTFFKKNIIVK